MTIIRSDREALLAARDGIYAGLNVSPAQFHEAEAARSLEGSEWEAKENLDAISFLLGETTFDDE